jgi:hypothetical protein
LDGTDFDKMDNLDNLVIPYEKVFLVQEWVRQVCGPEYGKHHGYEHAESVSALSFMIYNEIVHTHQIDDGLDILVRIIGYFHDIDDSKIDKDGSKRRMLDQFLQENFPPYQQRLIRGIIDRILHSKEVKMRKEMDGNVDWVTVLGETGKLIRDIVSDADKLESLGVEGFIRSKEYNKERLGLTDSVEDQKRCFAEVNEIIESKLKTLHEYLYTEPGKKMGIERTAALLRAHEKWRVELFG